MGSWVRPCAALFFTAALACCASAARAEMCSGEYQTGARRLSKEERAREHARRAEEREKAEAAERARLAAEEAERLARAQRRAALPLGALLVEDRCTACHAAATLAGERRGWLGWWAVVLRMEVFNSARFAAGERGVIVDHLVARQAADPARVALEWTTLAGAVAVPLLLWLGLRQSGRRRSD